MDNLTRNSDTTPDEASGNVQTADRRTARRAEMYHQVALIGNYGTFNGFITNLSYLGALTQVDYAVLGLPPNAEGTELLNQTLKDQFGRGLVMQFTGTDLNLEADLVRTSVRQGEQGKLVILGLRFRRHLSREECLCFQIDAPPVSAPASGPSGPSALPTAPMSVQAVPEATNIRELMRLAVEEGATDLHIKAGCRPRIRVAKNLTDLQNEPISMDLAHLMALDLMTAEQANRFELEGDMELTCNVEDAGRFRISVFRQMGCTGISIRCIPDNIPTIQDLGLSPVAYKLAEKPHGLVLVTGPTGSGKSTTLAAMIDHINRSRACNIITMEDPIEYVHRDLLCQINQREIGTDVVNFASALKRGLRQDPDVIMVGEMRDLETISLALTAAETGHLVFATLHTTSAAQTPSRIIDVFPPAQHAQIRVQLADSLQGIMSQILIPREDGGMVCAQEVLIASEGIRALIRENKPSQIENMMQTGGKEGMQTLETALNRLLEQRVISYEMALMKANNPKLVKRKGGAPTGAA